MSGMRPTPEMRRIHALEAQVAELQRQVDRLLAFASSQEQFTTTLSKDLRRVEQAVKIR